jgi:hypothetical protein
MIEAQVLGKDQDASLGHYLKEWLAHARGRVRATTYQGYEYLIRCYALPALGEVSLSELSPLHIQRLYSSLLVPERRLSAGTVLNLHLVPPHSVYSMAPNRVSWTERRSRAASRRRAASMSRL